jgi:hypothetical protein
MNIFALWSSAHRSAESLCDIHVVKMVLESTQMLYTVWHVCTGTDIPWLPDDRLPPYKKTHERHPCVIWALASAGHYLWLLRHARALSDEYTRRYHKVHKCSEHIARLEASGVPRRQPIPVHVKTGCRKRGRPMTQRKIQDSWQRVAQRSRKRCWNTSKLPVGWEWFECAIADDVFNKCMCIDQDGDLDVFATYRVYMLHKFHQWSSGRRPMKWRTQLD